MKLSILIVNYNVKYYLEQCLQSVFTALDALTVSAEVLVADNASTDGSESYILSRFSTQPIQWIANKKNVGFGRANNQLLAQATGEHILFLNPDTLVTSEVLENSMRFLDEHPKCGALGVKMLNGRGEFLRESKRGFPDPWTSFFKITQLYKLFPRSKRMGRYYLSWLSEGEIQEVDVLAGAYLYTRREALIDSSEICSLCENGIERKEGFDERFFMYGEDIDLSVRIQRAGWKNYYLPTPILHYKGESTSYYSLHYVERFYEAMNLFQQKYYPTKRNLNRIISVSIHALMGMKKLKCRIQKEKKEVQSLSSIRAIVCGREETWEKVFEAHREVLDSDSIFVASLEEIIDKYSNNKVIKYTHLVVSLADYSFLELMNYLNKHPLHTIELALYSPSSKVLVAPQQCWSLKKTD